MRYRYFLLLFLLCITYYGHAQERAIPFNDPRIHYMGRIAMTDSTAQLCWTASTVSLRFDGTGVSALLKDERGDNYYTVVIDGEPVSTLHLDSIKKSYTLASGVQPGQHSLELFKRTEWAMGKTWLYALIPDDHTTLLDPLPVQQRKIEFFGNSITCGYAVEDTSGKDRGTAPYENAYISYAAITARHFNAAFNCTAKSGIGITISWFPLIMPEMYDRLDPGNPNSKWDFSLFTPDIVVINLFQNDSWLINMPDHEQFKARFGKTAPGSDLIINAYKNFVQQVRGKYPNAYIICMLGNMDATKSGAPWPGYIQKSVDMLQDEKIFTLFVPFKGTPGHPSRAEQETLADSLIRFIDEHIHW
ncbi:MAG: hypothetical protein J0H74_31095 [Chitinophagaceae bacterium]|nr:hypothetical protein [Chitinophagaceae bacterium]